MAKPRKYGMQTTSNPKHCRDVWPRKMKQQRNRGTTTAKPVAAQIVKEERRNGV